MVSSNQKKLGELKVLLENKTRAETALKSIRNTYHDLQYFSDNESFYNSLSEIENHIQEELNRINNKLFEVESTLFDLLE